MLLPSQLPIVAVISLVGARDRVGHVDAETIYRQHRQRVYRLCLRLGGGHRDWAEDATHDVFVKLLGSLATLEAADDIGGWIYRVTVNTCLTRLKRQGSVWRRVRDALLAGPRATPETPERRVAVRQDLVAVLAELEELPAKERIVFCMRHLDELEQREIATTLALSEGYVSKLLQRAHARLESRGWEVPCA